MTAAFGASTFPFVWRETALDALRQMHDLGLNDFDVILAPGHCWPAELSTSARSELARTLDEDGIRVDSLNFPALDLNLASPIPEVRRYAVELYGEAIAAGGRARRPRRRRGPGPRLRPDPAPARGERAPARSRAWRRCSRTPSRRIS